MKFVSKDLALKLNEKGFDKPCFGFYITDGSEISPEPNCAYYLGHNYKDYLKKSDFPNTIDAPTIEQVLEWLREEKNIYITIRTLPTLSENFINKQNIHLIFDVRISYFKEDIFNYYDLDNPYFKYEDACIAGIEYVINNLI